MDNIPLAEQLVHFQTKRQEPVPGEPSPSGDNQKAIICSGGWGWRLEIPHGREAKLLWEVGVWVVAGGWENLGAHFI